jgi:putative transposase
VKRKRFAVEQITAILKQAEMGTPVADLLRQHGVSEQSFYRWKKVYGGMAPSEARVLWTSQDSMDASASSSGFLEFLRTYTT